MEFYIHVARDGRSLGRFAAQDIADGKASGKFRSNDLVWHDQLTEWTRLDALEGLPKAEVAAVPPPLPAVADEVTTQPNGPTWENRAEVGIVRAAWQTITEFLSNPPGTFERMALHAPWRPAMLFYVIVGTIAHTAVMAYMGVSFYLNPETLKNLPMEVPSEALVPSLVMAIFFLPMFICIKAFVMAGLLHAALRVMGNPAGDFWTTLRVYCYALGAASVFLFVPILGTYVELFFSISFLITGLRRVHNVPLFPAMGAVCLGMGMVMLGILVMLTMLGLAA